MSSGQKNALHKFLDGLQKHAFSKTYCGDFIVPFGRKHPNKAIRECDDKPWLEWVCKQYRLKAEHPIFFIAADTWLANSRPQEPKRDIGELVGTLNLRQESKEDLPVVAGLDFIDDEQGDEEFEADEDEDKMKQDSTRTQPDISNPLGGLPERSCSSTAPPLTHQSDHLDHWKTDAFRSDIESDTDGRKRIPSDVASSADRKSEHGEQPSKTSDILQVDGSELGERDDDDAASLARLIYDYFSNAKHPPELPPDIRVALNAVAFYVKQQPVNGSDAVSDGDVETIEP
ncbi:hypothetical protein CPB84DRAFT_1850154 [Gymnopilus junonius]|uniref:Uncharacterized protein n=1 Tax=Gymnopilus junonius TaxID=109634 RepID=A0A9P5NI35_GYMJU|nr:hypothetical protein CPB84DRAFT_1850154 [Gymnopilus junonius]